MAIDVPSSGLGLRLENRLRKKPDDFVVDGVSSPFRERDLERRRTGFPDDFDRVVEFDLDNALLREDELDRSDEEFCRETERDLGFLLLDKERGLSFVRFFGLVFLCRGVVVRAILPLEDCTLSFSCFREREVALPELSTRRGDEVTRSLSISS